MKDFNADIVARLQPFVSVLPNASLININFAPAEVLAAVVENMSLLDARRLVHQRTEKPFADVADFIIAVKQFGGIQAVANNLTVRSQYFWVTGHATVGEAQVTTQALLYRDNNWPTVVWRSVQ